MFLLTKTNLISFIIGVLAGVLAMSVYSFSEPVAVLILIVGIIVFELYCNKFGKEPDVVFYAEGSNFDGVDDFVETLQKMIEEVVKEDGDKK